MRIYLDHNAGAPLCAAAREAMVAALPLFGNPSSIHGRGRAARAAREAARRQVAALLEPGDEAVERVIFTSGGTEAIVRGLTGLVGAVAAPVVAVVATEHPAVHGAAAELTARGGRVVSIAVDGDGAIDAASLGAALAAGPSVVAMAAVNHELGTVTDLARWAPSVRAAGARLFVDAVAAAGRVPLTSVTALADAAAISSHKLGGPAGVGALWLAATSGWTPPADGGHQERGRRPGTENLLGVVGFGAAAAAIDLAAMPAMAARGARLEAALAAIPGARVHGAGAPRTGTTIDVGFDGVRGDTLVMALDLAGVEVSAGAACSSGSTAPSPVLRALGLDAEAARGGVRFSLGPGTTDDEIDRVVALVPAAVARARAATG